MRRGRWAIACLIGALALASCGRQSHPNDPRPAIPTEVTVAISDGDVSVQPSEVGLADSNQSISQNADQKEPKISSKEPVIASFTVANLTNTETKLQIDGPKSFTSNSILANGSANFKVSLPNGLYRVSADKLPGATAGSFRVGTHRSSSQNDLLLP